MKIRTSHHTHVFLGLWVLFVLLMVISRRIFGDHPSSGNGRLLICFQACLG